jgi:hypothetical protein
MAQTQIAMVANRIVPTDQRIGLLLKPFEILISEEEESKI